MGTLIRMEWRRFRGQAIYWALGHLTALILLAVYDDFFVPAPGKVRLGFVAYALSGFALGLYQVGRYRRRALWSFLVHRPLAPWRIFLSLAGAAALLLGIVIALPLLLVTLCLDGFSTHWVDLRQYWMVPFLWGLALVFYCGGSFLALRARWTAVPVLVLLLVVPFLSGVAPGAWIFLPLLLSLVWLGFVALTAFRPDPQEPPRGPLATLAQALPTQIAFFPAASLAALLLYSVVVIHMEAGWRGFAVFGWNDYFPMESYERAAYLGGNRLVAHGLRLADTPRGRDLLQALEAKTDSRSDRLGERVVVATPKTEDTAFFYLRDTRAPIRHALMFQEPTPTVAGPREGVRWIFSHDRMRFYGRDALTGGFVGWLGPEGRESPTPFAAVATLEGRRIVAGGSLYRHDPNSGRVSLELPLPAGERLIARVQEFHQGWAALSDHALYLLSDRSPRGTPRRLPFPGDGENLSHAAVVRVADTTLVAFLLGRLSERDAHPARLVVLEAAPEGESTVLLDRPLEAGAPAWVRHRGFLVSPLLQGIVDGVQGDPRAPRWSQVPPSLWWGALALALGSALATAWVARRRRLPSRSLWGWTVLAFLGGLPGLLSFFLLEPRSELDP